MIRPSHILAWLRDAGLDIKTPHRRDATNPMRVIRRVLAGRPVRTVMDCGARYGEMAVRFRKMFPECKVYSFEPTPETFQILQRNMRSDKNVELIQAAVGEKPGELNFYMNDDEQSNSFVKVSENAKVTTVKVVTIGDVCREKGIKHIDVLKIDVEGFELAAMKGMEDLLKAQEVDVIYSEVRYKALGPGCTDLVELVGYLQGLGYRFMGFYNTLYKRNLEFDWCDIILVSPKVLKDA